MTESRDRPPVVVLHVLEALSYGTSRHVVDLVRHVHGVEHHVVTPAVRSEGITDPTAHDALRAAGAQVHLVDMRRNPAHWVNARALTRITSIARRIDADVLHGHSAIGGALARAIPLRVPKVYTPNGLMPGTAATALERLLGRLTTAFVAVSESEASDAKRLRLVQERRLCVIPNGIELDVPEPAGAIRAELGLARGVPLVGSVMRLASQKAPGDFVDMARQVSLHRPDTHFVIVGDGPLAEATDAQAHDLGDRYHRVTHIVGVARSLDDLDVFVLLSRYEGGPYVALEAARACVPLVLTDVTGNRDVVVDGVSGSLVPFNSPGLAARAVEALLDDVSLRGDRSRAMAERMAGVFDVLQQGRAHAALYRRLVPAPGLRG